MAWPARTAEYERQVHAQGKVFVVQLPSNTNLGPAAAGAPGARTKPELGQRAVYEIAPVAVRVEMKWNDTLDAIGNLPGEAVVARDNFFDDIMTPIIEKLGLDHGVLGVAAKVAGIPLSVLILLLVFVAYGLLRQYGVVPPIKKVIE